MSRGSLADFGPAAGFAGVDLAPVGVELPPAEGEFVGLVRGHGVTSFNRVINSDTRGTWDIWGLGCLYMKPGKKENELRLVVGDTSCSGSNTAAGTGEVGSSTS